jgi:phosphoribosyl 1,2-cyclic phosphate phosphodiesterase
VPIDFNAFTMPPAPLKITVLGSGTSMGVPTLGCPCRVCGSTDPRDKRLRPSLLISRGGHNVVIDTSPDFRQQALRFGLDRLDAILLTHGHADHILGFDDIRPFNIRQRSALPVYSNEETFQIIRRVFAYVFDDKPTLSTVPSVTLRAVNGPFELLGIPFFPVPMLHGEMEVLGFRFGRAAYLTDFSRIPDSSMPLLGGLDELVLDALRDIPHPMHQTVEQALALVQQLKPRRAWFTHIAHDLPHAETNERLVKMGYPHVQLAYDGLQFEVQADDAADEVLPARSDSQIPRITLGESRPARLSAFSSSQAWASRYATFGHASVLAIGNFDGIHLGHQAILRATVERAQALNAVSTALTFDPSPRKVLRPESAPPRLSTNAQRMDWFNALGLEAVVVLPFTLDLARLTPEEFVEQILVRDLRVRAVLVGENFRFGHKQTGDVKLLSGLGTKHGFDVVIVPPVVYRGEVVSSTIIRREVAEGDVSHAARLPHFEPYSGSGTASRPGRLRHAHMPRRRDAQSPFGHQYRHAPDVQRFGAERRNSPARSAAGIGSEAHRSALLEASSRREKIQRPRGIARANRQRYRPRQQILLTPAPFPLHPPADHRWGLTVGRACRSPPTCPSSGFMRLQVLLCCNLDE